ncbi:MAG: hypothetical protein V4475_10750 [Pseudomonadota bacterium]
MPIIVPIEENKVGLATATDAKFRAPDYSGSGLEALGAELAQLGGGGQQLASSIEERRRRAAEAIAAAMLDDRHQSNIDDAAVKKAYVDYSDPTHEALHGEDGLFNQQGAGAHAAFPGLVEKLVDNHDKALSKLDDVQRAAVAPVMNQRLRKDVDRAADYVRQQGAAEQKWQSEQLQKVAARDAVNHANDPDLFDHHLATGEKTIRQQAKIDNLGDKLLEKQIADYKSGVHADTIETLNRLDPDQAADWHSHNSDKLNEVDKQRVETKLAGDVTGEFVDPNDDPARLAMLQAAAKIESQHSELLRLSPQGMVRPDTKGDADGQGVSHALLRPQLLTSLERQASIEERSDGIAAPPAEKAPPSRRAKPAHSPAAPGDKSKVHVDVHNVGPGRQPAGPTSAAVSSPRSPTGKRAVTQPTPSPLAQAMQRLGRDRSYDRAFWGEFRPTPNDEDDFALIGKPDPNYRPPPKAQWGRISATFADQKIREDALELVALGALTGMDEVGILEYFGIPKKWAMASMGLLKPALDLGEEGFKKRLWNTYFNMAYITLRQGGQVSVNEDTTNLGPD